MEAINGTLSIFTIAKSTKSPCPPMENMSQVNLYKSGSVMASIFVGTTYCFLVWIKCIQTQETLGVVSNTAKGTPSTSRISVHIFIAQNISIQSRLETFVDLSIQFAQLVPYAVTCLVYAEFKSFIEVDKRRNILFDFST